MCEGVIICILAKMENVVKCMHEKDSKWKEKRIIIYLLGITGKSG